MKALLYQVVFLFLILFAIRMIVKGWIATTSFSDDGMLVTNNQFHLAHVQDNHGVYAIAGPVPSKVSYQQDRGS